MSGPVPAILRFVPNGLSVFRLALAPVLYVSVVSGRGDAAAVCLAMAMATDVLDGLAARRLAATSRLGAYLDVWADFVVVEAAFAGFSATRTGPLTIPVLAALSFGLFVLSARYTSRFHDPIGRNIGGILLGSAFVVLAVRDLMVMQAAFIVATGALLVTLVARSTFVFRSLKGGFRP